MKVLVAGMGNVLRGDDGFGIWVVEALAAPSAELPKGVDVYEAGIGGIGLVQELMNGYEALILVDAIDKGRLPGTLFVVQPMAEQTPIDDLSLHQSMVDMHYADPSKVLLLACALGVCPETVYLVGCQPEYVDDAVESLTDAVQKAVPLAVDEIRNLLRELSVINDPIS